jgi:hypothetical protein
VKEYRRTAQEHYDHAVRFQAVAEQQLDTLRDAQNKGYQVASFAEYRTLGGSGGVNTVPVVQEIARIEEEMRHAPALAAALQQAARTPSGKEFRGVHQTFSAQKKRLTGSAAGIAQQAWARGEAVVDRIVRLREQTNSRPAKWALAVMVLLSVAGLIAPLGWLTAIRDWSKPTLLILFAVGIVGLLFVVWHQIRELDRVGNVEDFNRAFNELD